VGYDNGSEQVVIEGTMHQYGHNLKKMVMDYNPQSNALIEQVHPVLEMHYACSN